MILARPEGDSRVTPVVDTDGIRLGEQRIPWSAVVTVALRTTDEGPMLEDLWWCFVLQDGAVEVPGVAVTGEILRGLQEWLPGLDSIKIARAMGCTEERVFRVWSRAHPARRSGPDALATRFARLTERLGGRADSAEATARALLERWSEPHRHYHDLEHLTEVLAELDEAAAQATALPDPDRLELALWYHDAIYEPRARDNEAKSAALLVEDARMRGLPSQATQDAARLVGATAHLGRRAASPPADEAWIIDLDLAILGQEPYRFMDFEHSVAEEYTAVPRPLYFYKRGRFLKSLLERPAIYLTPHFRERYEVAARRNLQALLQSPRYRWWRYLF